MLHHLYLLHKIRKDGECLVSEQIGVLIATVNEKQ